MIPGKHQDLLEMVAEAQGGLSEVAFKLRRELTPKAPAFEGSNKGPDYAFFEKVDSGATSRDSGPVGDDW